ncbi:hypothetical protein AUJ46_02710 [Candidatus Peregrinibacteria bacterium CG1_02_54_53]|nr:MAG: hypothetical protein AUJ46_02710 [Candidatus Peregrinibacteria bacterium CG1_02_54_53]
MFLYWRKSESLLGASKEERHEAIETLVSTTTFRQGYYLLLTLSAIIVTSGLLIANIPIVIGGMVVAPVLAPILLLAVSLVSHSRRGIVHACTVLVMSILIVLALSITLTWIVAYATPITAIIPQEINPFIYFLVAFCSGIVASFAWVKKDLTATIAGVAISISLLPPLCIAGISLALMHAAIMRSSLMVFGMNVIGILLASILTFLQLGFFSLTKVTEKTVEKEQKAAEGDA